MSKGSSGFFAIAGPPVSWGVCSANDGNRCVDVHVFPFETVPIHSPFEAVDLADAVPELRGGHIEVDVMFSVALGVIGVDAVCPGRVGYECLGVEDGDSR